MSHTQVNSPDLPDCFDCICNHRLRSLLISCIILIPCFWHRHIEAGDLGSHIYNAWIVHLIRAGHTHGLWLATRWNNVCFDFMLDGLGSLLGYVTAEKIATAATVLIVFWGAFLFVAALSGSAPWKLSPFIAMIVFGWTFEMGFMNCYLSIGLAFLALAFLLAQRGWGWIVAIALVPIIWLAHPFGIVVFFAFGAYTVVSQRLEPRGRMVLFALSAGWLLAVHLFIRIHFASGVVWKSAYVHDGFDQLLLFGKHYLAPARLLRGFAIACVLVDLLIQRGDRGRLGRYRLPAELYVLTVLAVQMVPSFIDSSRMRHMGFISIGFVTERLTTVLAVLVCCILASAAPGKWHLPTLSVITIVFFGLLYRDTGAISHTEDQLDEVVQTLPGEQRVVSSPVTFLASNVGTEHVIDSACVGRCFSYNNYEPRVGQFRVRADMGNGYFLMDPYINQADAQVYIAKRRDLPLDEITPCAASKTGFCVNPVAEGQSVKVGYKLDRSWLSRFSWSALLLDLLVAAVIAAVIAARQRVPTAGPSN